MSNILAECLQAFSAFGYPARQKHFKLTRPIIAVDGADANAFGLSIGINVEYSQTPPCRLANLATGSYSLWDSAIWDSSMWVGGYSPAKQDWLTCPAVGYNAALHMKVTNRITDLNWINTDFIFEVGVWLMRSFAGLLGTLYWAITAEQMAVATIAKVRSVLAWCVTESSLLALCWIGITALQSTCMSALPLPGG